MLLYTIYTNCNFKIQLFVLKYYNGKCRYNRHINMCCLCENTEIFKITCQGIAKIITRFAKLNNVKLSTSILQGYS